jgi:putative DNA primase/helicase
MNDPFAPVRGFGARRAVNPTQKWILVAPVPADGTPAPAAHPTLGKASTIWTYRDASGAVLGQVWRFDGAQGKQFRPLTCWRPAANGMPEWRWQSWPPKRPLYGLERAAEQPVAPVLIVEGEKCADAAMGLLPGFVALASPNGSNGAAKADWSPLKGRAVTIWPDADAAGLDYARQVAKLATAAGARTVTIVSPPRNVKVGWDAADALADGWTTKRAAELVAAASPAEKIENNENTTIEREGKLDPDFEPTGRHRTPQRDVLIGLTQLVELWHDANRIAYGSFPVNDHRENSACAISGCGCPASFLKKLEALSVARRSKTACAYSRRAR